MFPLSDENPTRRTPILTWLLILINIGVFVWQLQFSPQELTRVFFELSVVPANIAENPFSLETALDILRSMFFHGGFAHIAFNMLYMYLFADNVEDRLGRVPFLLLYFISGIMAVVAQVIITFATGANPNVPMVGASGAIAGVLGSYLIMYPGVSVRGIVPLGWFAFFTKLPAWIVLGFWFVLQVVNGIASLGAESQFGGGVAFFAHIGGFVAGMVLTGIMLVIFPQPSRERRYQTLYDRAENGGWF
jgi:membrane associated rhomboid family serine protease